MEMTITDRNAKEPTLGDELLSMYNSNKSHLHQFPHLKKYIESGMEAAFFKDAVLEAVDKIRKTSDASGNG